MIIKDIENIKGFMPLHEGEALYKWSKEFSKLGPIIEIGTYCGKSTIYLGLGANENNEVVFTIDHHSGSEEHQLKEEYFDPEVFDIQENRVNTFPLFLKNIQKYNLDNIIPIVSSSKAAAKSWDTSAGMIFIDGGHSLESAFNDYNCWSRYVKKNGALVIHDIYEDPNEGGQAPYEIYKEALKNDFIEHDRVDTIVCLKRI